MPRILLDGSELEVANAVATWGGVLDDVDRRLAEAGRIVTDVRFDGLDEPAFREPGTLARPLTELVMLEVLSGTPSGLMDRCLEEAVAAISPLCAAAMTVGESFRSHRIRPASAELAELADGLSSLIGIVGAAGLAFQVDLRHLRCGDQAASSLVSELGMYLEALVAAQENGDWLSLADILQFDIEPCLKRLAPLLESLRQDQRPS
ncbi:MAG: hypothetical protein AB7I50_26890 [Vicinamibacterales bacterium]